MDLNTATADELLQLNGIGKAKSQKIINYREHNQCFTSIDELASIDGISEKIIEANRVQLRVSACSTSSDKDAAFSSSYKDVLLDPINIIFTIVILVLGFIDHTRGKDLKSQIVSVGVLGTFVGIFIGLQSFNPEDISNSVNDILVGLKTAFFTSIVGMGVSTLLSVTQTLQSKQEDE